MSIQVSSIARASNSIQSNASMNTDLSLWFTSEPRIELFKSKFNYRSLESPIHAIRGRTSGAYQSSATFQWSSAVQALCILLLKAIITNGQKRTEPDPLLEGGRGSLAASLDAALYKQTAWLDMFGCNVQGYSLARNILMRSNPGRRRPGPVMISLNERMLPTTAINIYIDGQLETNTKKLKGFIKNIYEQWEKAHNRLSLCPSKEKEKFLPQQEQILSDLHRNKRR